MRIKNDDVLAHLRSFGFTMQENNAQGFIRWQKRIGDMLVTIANGQFENKIRVSLLQDRNGNIRTSYKDILAYTELICSGCRTDRDESGLHLLSGGGCRGTDG